MSVLPLHDPVLVAEGGRPDSCLLDELCIIAASPSIDDLDFCVSRCRSPANVLAMGDVAASPPPPDAALAAAASSGDMAAVTDADASCSKPGELRLLALAPPALTSDVADSALRNRRGGASGSSPLLPPPSLPLLRSGLSSKRALAHSGFRSERPLIPCTTLLKRRWESDVLCCSEYRTSSERTPGCS